MEVLRSRRALFKCVRDDYFTQSNNLSVTLNLQALIRVETTWLDGVGWGGGQPCAPRVYCNTWVACVPFSSLWTCAIACTSCFLGLETQAYMGDRRPQRAKDSIRGLTEDGPLLDKYSWFLVVFSVLGMLGKHYITGLPLQPWYLFMAMTTPWFWRPEILCQPKTGFCCLLAEEGKELWLYWTSCSRGWVATGQYLCGLSCFIGKFTLPLQNSS